MKVSDRTRNVLKALEYTPEKFAKDTGVSINRTNLILNGDGILDINDFIMVLQLTGIQPNLLYGMGMDKDRAEPTERKEA